MPDAGVNGHQHNTELTAERDQLMADPAEDEREMQEVDRALEEDQVEETRQWAWALAQQSCNGQVRIHSIYYHFSLILINRITI